ncbi:hypothetical protein PC9H_002020 [Pleurotus ostreatus]|uniref:Uncharacterized protein n=1 Tax=Pleurotus ostreatus TaxID=5322 RepID=A0A8H6ZPK2_PLEOS|nr:uncharacterized protein PC9H_002020 [Pleurotus ostreatus]KAF7419430.1 hypothetical protein PC9H_002020 [Pleurotus ostreatus]
MDGQLVLSEDFFVDTQSTTRSEPRTPVHHIIAGSFRSLSLFLLAFSPFNRTISHVQTIPAFGPHQYLALNSQRDRVYTTTWAQPPSLSSWSIDKNEHTWDKWTVNLVNMVPITATSSYITLPPPYTHIYSAGGPAGEVHIVEPSTRGFGAKAQQLLFVPEDELAAADKTRRYGSHAIEISNRGFAFIPVLGTNSIERYRLSSSLPGGLDHIGTTLSPRPHDGPRHLIISPNGSKLYVVTEHTNFLDVYDISHTGDLTLAQSRSIIPQDLRPHVSLYRGDTLRFTPPSPSHPSPGFLFATTRGATSETRGWLTVFRLDQDGAIVGEDAEDDTERWETPTSGGKANAIEIIHGETDGGEDTKAWVLLTDDDESVESGGPGIRVIEWSGWKKGISVAAEWPGERDFQSYTEGDRMRGGSHAVWLD